MRHRKKKIKHEHAMIQGLRERLYAMTKWAEITSVIPGAIRPVKKPSSSLVIRVQYETSSGIKCLVKSGTAVQELFIVTPQKAELRRRMLVEKKTQ